MKPLFDFAVLLAFAVMLPQAHAVLYTATLLDPLSSYENTYADGVSGSSQVGYASETATGLSFALMWSGSAASVVDLHPAGFAESVALAVSGSSQVGWGRGSAPGDKNHALL